MVDPRQKLITASVLDPAAKRWTDRTAELLAGFTLDVHGDGVEVYPFDAQLICSAAWQLWCTSGNKPCWGKLDVHQLIARFTEGAGDDEALLHHVGITLAAFYCYLVKHEHLSKRKARRVVDDLDPLWQRAWAMVIADLARGPGDEPRDPPEASLN